MTSPVSDVEPQFLQWAERAEFSGIPLNDRLVTQVLAGEAVAASTVPSERFSEVA